MNIEQIQLYQPDKKYSYVAPEERTSIILQNMNKLKKGMTSDQVIALLTAPDEAHLTYKSIKKATDKTDNMTGFRWYIC